MVGKDSNKLIMHRKYYIRILKNAASSIRINAHHCIVVHKIRMARGYHLDLRANPVHVLQVNPCSCP